MLERLAKMPITQLYITLPAPDKETFERSCNPLIPGAWKKIRASLKLLPAFNCRKAIRITLAKGCNMLHPEAYAELIKGLKADFFEIKAYMHVGYSRYRLEIGNMPLHSEIKAFAEQIAHYAGLSIIDEKPLSRVVLLQRANSIERLLQNK